jgi:hypothetical protein
VHARPALSETTPHATPRRAVIRDKMDRPRARRGNGENLRPAD